jgi:phosphoribosylanthranilate isomerase
MSSARSFYRTRVKICGLKSFEEAKIAADCGADSIGLVFHAPSPRYIEMENAIAIRRALPAFVTLTALFLNETDQWVGQVVEQLKPDCLQFHGTESPEFCQRWGLPYIKAIPMASVENPDQFASEYKYAQGFLMDSNAAGRLGGSGDTFDWSKIPSDFHYPLILAGGLTPLNVADAVTQVTPWAVDVSSGVEKSRGVKDPLLIQQFCKEVHRVDCRG